MTVQHRDIPDAQIHEPKGAASATSGQVYVANGGGSGTWKDLGSDSLQGLSTNTSDFVVLQDGSGGFKNKRLYAYGTMAISGNTNAFAVSAAADSSLNTNSDYVLLTGTGAPWASENLNGLTFSTNQLVVPVSGIYRLDMWSTISQFPTNTARVSVKHRVNGGTFSVRHPVCKSNSAGDFGQLGGFGLINLNANDFVQLYVASTAAGGLIFSDVNIAMELVKAA